MRLNFKTRPVMEHEIDEQWQIDLVDMSKLLKHNNGFKFVMVDKFVWLERSNANVV